MFPWAAGGESKQLPVRTYCLKERRPLCNQSQGSGPSKQTSSPSGDAAPTASHMLVLGGYDEGLSACSTSLQHTTGKQCHWPEPAGCHQKRPKFLPCPMQRQQYSRHTKVQNFQPVMLWSCLHGPYGHPMQPSWYSCSSHSHSYGIPLGLASLLVGREPVLCASQKRVPWVQPVYWSFPGFVAQHQYPGKVSSHTDILTGTLLLAWERYRWSSWFSHTPRKMGSCIAGKVWPHPWLPS